MVIRSVLVDLTEKEKERGDKKKKTTKKKDLGKEKPGKEVGPDPPPRVAINQSDLELGWNCCRQTR